MAPASPDATGPARPQAVPGARAGSPPATLPLRPFVYLYPSPCRSSNSLSTVSPMGEATANCLRPTPQRPRLQ